MKQLTLEQKIKAVEIAIQRCELEKTPHMCDNLSYGIDEVTMFANCYHEDVFDYLPEFVKYKPEYTYDICGSWFNTDEAGKQSRITILNALLSEYKEMLNQVK